MFDRDDAGIIKKVSDGVNPFKYWGKNVYSIVLPRPQHRQFKEICIEHYYADADLNKKDKKNRRIFLTSEFDKSTGKHLKEPQLSSANKHILQSSFPKILDQKIHDESGENVALTKNAFADNIINKIQPFDSISFENFEDFFIILQNVINHNEDPLDETS